jgi:hypothetical protein
MGFSGMFSGREGNGIGKYLFSSVLVHGIFI